MYCSRKIDFLDVFLFIFNKDYLTMDIGMDIGIDMLGTGIAKIDLSELKPVVLDSYQPFIMQTPIVDEIFNNEMDIYNSEVSRQERYIVLEVPNIRCSGRYFDDEDFIYARMKFSDGIELKELDYITYQLHHGFDIHASIMIEPSGAVGVVCVDDLSDLNSSRIMAIVLYLYQYTNAYYTSLRHLRPLERMRYLPVDLLNWMRYITGIIRKLLDLDLFHYQTNEEIPQDMFDEMKYGLGLIACHARLICNHYNSSGLIDLRDGLIEEKHLKKIMRLVNNLCVIMIYFKMIF